MKSPVRSVRKTAATIAAAGLVLTTGACGDDGGTSGGIELVSEDTLTICTHLPYKPFQYRDDNGEVVGFDTDILGLLAEDLDVGTEVVDIDWNQITSGAAFASKKCDVGMGAMTITDERAEAILISEPYFDATQALLVTGDASYEGLEDLDGKKLGVQTDTTGQIYGDDHAEEHGYETVVYDDALTQFNAVKTGSVDAAINDNGPLYDFAKSNSDVQVTSEFDTGEQYGFAAQKDDDNAKQLIDRLNDVIAESKSSGQYEKLYKKWFGTLPGKKGGSQSDG